MADASKEKAEEKATKKAAQEAITLNTCVLSDALKLDGSILLTVVQKCVSKRLFTQSEMTNLFDSYTNRTLAERASKFVSMLHSLVGVLPDELDEILCILYETENLVVQEAAKSVANKCKFHLPKYEALRRPVVSAEATGTLIARGSASSRIAEPQAQQQQQQDATLCITHLSEVRSALREGKFKNSSWIDLGDALGLHPNTLSTIEANYPRDSDRCARECLVKWLDRADGVDEKGGANWKTLSNALEAAGQKNAADYIRSSFLSSPGQSSSPSSQPTNASPSNHSVTHSKLDVAEDERMQTLFGMGFLDREKNARLLRKYSNNLVLVIEELLSVRPGVILDENNRSDN